MDSIRVGDFELFPSERVLSSEGRPVELGARAFDMLLVLVENPGRLVTKATLLDRVWPKVIVDEKNLPAQIAGCEECLKVGDRWLHLRMCMTCGKIGCCDSSPNKHASKHARAEGHPIIRSAEPGEDWSYCFIDEVGFVLT